jgi:4'-phosphopantetheinyl transferase
MVGQLQPGEIHVWRVPLSSDALPSAIEGCRLLLSIDEQVRAERFRTEPLRTAFVLCHGAVRRILAKYAGVAPVALEFDLEPHGKPVLRPRSMTAARKPLHFNLSHTADLAIVGVSVEPIGIDVERVRQMPDADRLACRFFSRAEYEAFRAGGHVADTFAPEALAGG